MVLFENALVTVRRLVIGLVAGIGLGIGVGLLVGMSRWARDVVLPPVLLLRTIPILALIPLFMFWFGAREIGILIFVSLRRVFDDDRQHAGGDPQRAADLSGLRALHGCDPAAAR